jgi:hypothetical protein
MIVTLDLDLDFDLLREQKAILAALLFSSPFTKDEKQMADEAIEGILAMIDGIQDEAADLYGDPTVYGPAEWVIVDPQDSVVGRYLTTDQALADMTEDMMERGFAILHRPDPGLL